MRLLVSDAVFSITANNEIADSSFVGTELQEQAIRNFMDKVFAAPKITKQQSDKNTRELEELITTLETLYTEEQLKHLWFEVTWGGKCMHCKIGTLRALRTAREEFRNDVQ